MEVFQSLHRDECAQQNAIAWRMTKQFVRYHLGSADAAHFPSRYASDGLGQTRFEYLGDCRHRIQAYVDAVYETGEVRRRHFVAEVSNAGRSGWQLDDLDFTALP